MIVFFDVREFLLLCAGLLIAALSLGFAWRMWRGRRERLKRIPKSVSRPDGYGGAVRMDYSEHPDAELERRQK